ARYLSIVGIAVMVKPCIARNARALEERDEAIAIRRDQQCVQPVELGTVGGKLASERGRVAEADVAPHFRIAAGKTREVAKAGCGVAKIIEGVSARRQQCDQREGKRMRQVTDGGEDL